MTAPDLRDPRIFLGAFFGPGNDLSLAHLRSSADSVSACARNWLMGIEDQPLGARPLLLPRVRGGEFVWYGLAFDERQFRQLREEITAFVGPSYSDFRGARAVLSPRDPQETAILRATEGRAIRLRPGRGQEQAFLDALQLLFAVSRSSRARPAARHLGTERLLRDFHLALTAGNRPAGVAALERLRREQRLDEQNLRFLEVQLRAAFECWRELLELPFLPELVQSRRPRLVTGALLTAWYRERLARFERDNDPRGAIQRFREEVLPRRGSLLDHRAGLQEPDIVKMFMLLAVASEPPRPELRQELLALPDLAEPDRAYLEALGRTLDAASRPVGDLLAEAQEACDDGDFDRAYLLALGTAPSPRRARILLQCADELGDPALTADAVDAARVLDGAGCAELFRLRWVREVWTRLTGTEPGSTAETPPVPRGWAEWLARCVAGDMAKARLVALAADGAQSWPIAPLASDEAVLARCEEALVALAGEEVLQESLPHLVAACQDDRDYPHRSLLSFYDLLRSTLEAGMVGPTSAELAVFNDLSQAVLHLGAGERLYRRLLDEASRVVARAVGYQSARALVDLLDLLAGSPSPCPGQRRAVATQLISRCVLWAETGQLSAQDWRLLGLLSRSLGLQELTAAAELPEYVPAALTETADPLTRLRGRIGIYTLTETAGLHVRQILRSLCPGVTVELNSDRVETRSLRELSLSADVLVMVAASAKHAATQAIERHRPSGKPLLRVNSRGMSGILSALADHAAEQQASGNG